VESTRTGTGSHKNLPAGVRVGIAIGAAIGVTILVASAVLFIRRHRQRSDSGKHLNPHFGDRPPARSRGIPQFGHITPFPAPSVREASLTESETLSPPTVPSTNGGIRPYGAQHLSTSQSEKRRRAGVVVEAGEDRSDPLSPEDDSVATEVEQRAVNRVLALIAERIDQIPGIEQRDSSAPPSYPSQAATSA
jgi:hypothetical protein